MAIDKKDTQILKERFLEHFDQYPEVINENQHGSDGVVIYTDAISLRELNDLKRGIHNTMSLSSQDGKLRISVW